MNMWSTFDQYVMNMKEIWYVYVVTILWIRYDYDIVTIWLCYECPITPDRKTAGICDDYAIIMLPNVMNMIWKYHECIMNMPNMRYIRYTYNIHILDICLGNDINALGK